MTINALLLFKIGLIQPTYQQILLSQLPSDKLALFEHRLEICFGPI